MLLAGSVTDSVVTWATHVIQNLGVVGVWLLTLTSAVIGVPGSEPTMLFAGFNVSEGHMSILGIIVFGVLGDMMGASIAYAIGYFGRRELIERHGRKLHVSATRLDRANAWFERFGSPVIFFSRLIPLVRAVFPYAAGVSEMPFPRFFLFATLGSVVWITGLALVGRAVGSDWQSWRHNLAYVDYVALGLLVALVVFVVVRRVRRGGAKPAADAVSK